MRRVVILAIVLALAGCQAATTDYNAKPKACDQRAVESGFCVPGEYEGE
ncbi:MAG TPA: hypothetical protein VIZ90_01695 [Rhizobiaceae bacterium]